MGMDVYGVNAENKTGEYFRRNVWGWRGLWDYCLDTYEIANKVANGHSNDGDGLNAEDSRLLAEQMYSDIASGASQDYITARNHRLASLDRPACKTCDGTGIRTDEVGVFHDMPTRELSPEMASLTGRTHGFCNACSGEGKTDDWETNYSLDLDDIKEFAEFLENCGGFKIC
jgi:hypothetical protein